MKYSPTIAIKLSKEVVEEGRSVLSVCRIHPTLDEKELRLWCRLYRTYGEGVFMNNREFGLTLRKAIIKDKLTNGLSIIQTCVKYKILSRSGLRNWIRSYRSDISMKRKRETGKKKATAKTSSDPARLRELEEEVLFLKAENAYLKKLQALMQQGKKN